MLNSAPVVTMMPAVDLERARQFYQGVLGLKPAAIPGDVGPDTIAFEAGSGSMIGLYRRGPTKADHTVATFLVADIEATIDWLVGRGVKFEQYDMPDFGLKTDARGIATFGTVRTAWFIDTEGNILAIDQVM